MVPPGMQQSYHPNLGKKHTGYAQVAILSKNEEGVASLCVYEVCVDTQVGAHDQYVHAIG